MLRYLYSGEQARAQAAAAAEAAAAQQAAMAAVEAEAKQETSTEAASTGSSIDLSDYSHRVVSFLARNFYNLKYVALALAFCINFMLLFYKVGGSFIIDNLYIYNLYFYRDEIYFKISI